MKYVVVSKGPSLYSYCLGDDVRYKVKTIDHRRGDSFPYKFTVLDRQSREVAWGIGTLVRFRGSGTPYEIRFADYEDLVIKITREFEWNKVNIHYNGEVIPVDIYKASYQLFLDPWKIDLRFRLCNARAFVDTEMGDNLAVPVSILFILGLLRVATYGS